MPHSIEYNIGRYHLSINFWFLIVFLIVQTGLNELGFWQISRAQEKQLFLDKINRQDEHKNISLDQITQADIENFTRVKLQVTSDFNRPILLENVIQNGELGYQVLSLVTDKSSHKRLLVNRGWINAKANRSEVPNIKATALDWEVSGRLFPIHSEVLSGKAEIEFFPNLVRIPVLDQSIVMLLEKEFNSKIEPYVVRLDEQSDGHFDIAWNWVSMSPEKHLGYAFQWFGLSFAFLIASLFALIKKKPNKAEIEV